MIGGWDGRAHRSSVALPKTHSITMTAFVQVFGRRHDGSLDALWRPASEKRQGTKSREVGRRLGSERYGDLMRAPISMIDVRVAGLDVGLQVREVSGVRQAFRRVFGEHQRAIRALLDGIGSREIAAGVEPAH